MNKMVLNDVKLIDNVAILRPNAKAIFSGYTVIQFVLSASDTVEVSINGDSFFYSEEYGDTELNANQLYQIQLYNVTGDIPVIKAVNSTSFSLIRILNYPSREFAYGTKWYYFFNCQYRSG